MTEETKLTQEEALKIAYDAGRTAGKAEAAPVEFPNKLINQMPGGEAGYRAYEAELSAKAFELRSQGVRNVRTHPDILSIQERYEER